MSKVTIPFWSVDTFLYFLLPQRCMSEWSSELISRVSTFIDAYILYDKIVLPQRYENEPEILQLDTNQQIFEYISPTELVHSDDLRRGISLDFSLNMTNFETLMNENFKWFSQHRGNVTLEEYSSLVGESDITIAHLRLWQLGLTNEISEKRDAAIILPPSLQGIETGNNERSIPFHVSKLDELDNHFQDICKSIVANLGEDFVDQLTNVPPFLSLLLDQSPSRELAIDTLIQLRNDYRELRRLTASYQGAIIKATGHRDKKDVIHDWNASWESILKSDFRKPRLARKQISISDFSKAVVKESSTLSTLIQTFLEYREERQAYKRFKIFGDLYNELEQVSNLYKSLKTKFQIDLVNKL